MTMFTLAATVAASLSFSAQAATPEDAHVASPAQVEADVRFLADDLLEGREAGTRGHEVAVAYVISRFRGLGLQPAGVDGGWTQQMTLRTATLDAEQSSVALINGNGRVALDADMALPRPSLISDRMTLDAPLVFVGRGLDAAALGHDDFGSVDVTGKIVVYLNHLPSGLQADHLGHLAQAHAKMAADRGAVGLISISVAPEANAKSGYLETSRSSITNWVDDAGRNGSLPEGMKLNIAVSPEGAKAIMAGSQVPLDQLITMARNNEALPSFDLPGRLEATAVSSFKDVGTPNVMAKIPGSNPDMADEYVVMVAHLDHVGIKKNAAPGEDAIHNGALDNAAGVATMLETARLFMEAGNQPDRSILFIAVTAEEKGLLGAEYFAANPTVPLDSIVADLSLDMPVPLYQFTDIVAFGAEHGSISDYISNAAATMNIKLSPDPMPEQTIFVRSDHYIFAQEGIPAVLLFTGYANGGEAVWADFFATRYHQVGDDLTQNIHWDALARYATLNYRIAMEIAEDEGRPLWYEGNFFGDIFDPNGERAPAP